MESTTLKVEKKLLAEITDLKQQLEDMNSDIVATEAEDLEHEQAGHVDPEQVAQKEQAVSIAAETDANLAKQAAVSKKKAATKQRSRLRFMSRRKPSRRRRTNSRVIATQVDRFDQGHVSD